MSITTDKPITYAGNQLTRELRTAEMVWRREAIRFFRAKTRILVGFGQPIIYLFVLGTGLSPLVGSTAGFNFRKFLFPGVVAMSVVTTAIFSAVSIVWDREFGFLREMLVAPVSRFSLVAGKTAGGATVASFQGLIMLVLAPFIGVHLTPLMVLELVPCMLLMAIALTGFGVFIASRITKMESFQVVMQLVMFPMIMLSGAMFPLNNLPTWLSVLTRLNPLTYAIAPIRHVVFSAQHVPPAALARFPSSVELFGHHLRVAQELGIVAVFAVVFLALASRGFSTVD